MSSSTDSPIARVRGAWKRFVNSDELEWAFELCNRYAIAFLVLNLVVFTVLTNPILSAILMAGILVHESGHYLVQRYYGYKPELYVFPLLGAGISEEYEEDEKESLSLVGQRDVFLAGPATELLFTVVVTGAYLTTGMYELFAFAVIFPLNAFFNLAPVWKVDGGRARTVRRQLAEEGQSREVLMTTLAHVGLVFGNFAVLVILWFNRPTGLRTFVRSVLGM